MKTYKSHYACFKCRKTFKRRLLVDIEGRDEFQLKEAICPQCKGLIANMGKDFEAPEKYDIKKWEHIKSLYSVGITFHSCGCTGPSYIPNTKESLIRYFGELLQEYHRNLNFWRQLIESTNVMEINRENGMHTEFVSKIPYDLRSRQGIVSNEDAKAHWMNRIKQIEQKLASLIKDHC